MLPVLDPCHFESSASLQGSSRSGVVLSAYGLMILGLLLSVPDSVNVGLSLLLQSRA